MNDIIRDEKVGIVIRRTPSGWVLMYKEKEVYSFDPNKRPRRLFTSGRSFRRGTDHRTFEVYQPGSRESNTVVRELTDKEKRALYEELLKRLKHIISILGDTKKFEDDHCVNSARDFFSFVYNRNIIDDWEADYERFHSIYKAISILPPDRYRALVIQVCEGCPWNRCTFCKLFTDRNFRQRTLEEVKKHARSIKEFFKDGLNYYQSIFLADANTLVMKTENLLKIILWLKDFFSDYPLLNRFDSFVDIRSGYKKSLEELKTLKEAGMKRIYIGVETGAEELREFLNKSGKNEEVIEFIKNSHLAGLEISAIFMVGVGGDKYSLVHIEKTIKLLKQIK